MKNRILFICSVLFILSSCKTTRFPHFDYNNGPNPQINAFKDNVFFPVYLKVIRLKQATQFSGLFQNTICSIHMMNFQLIKLKERFFSTVQQHQFPRICRRSGIQMSKKIKAKMCISVPVYITMPVGNQIQLREQNMKSIKEFKKRQAFNCLLVSTGPISSSVVATNKSNQGLFIYIPPGCCLTFDQQIIWPGRNYCREKAIHYCFSIS